MSAPIDVLEVLETVAFRTYESQPLMPSKEQERICVLLAAELREARAAVAELMEAAKPFASPSGFPIITITRDDATVRRLYAALAKCGVAA